MVLDEVIELYLLSFYYYYIYSNLFKISEYREGVKV